jgi:alkylated DNA repair protein alkB family protein 1
MEENLYKVVQKHYHSLSLDGDKWYTQDTAAADTAATDTAATTTAGHPIPIPPLVDFSSAPPTSPLSSPSSLSSPSPCYTLPSHPGFLYYPRSLSKSSQVKLAMKCLTEYCEPPHDTNISNVAAKEHEVDLSHGMFAKSFPCTDLSSHYHRLDKLSWSTNGYNYDWSIRAYHPSKHSPFPPELTALSHLYVPPPYVPQASIINFYKPKSVMGGHLDDLEVAKTPPVISMSLGLPAIFLLGGATKGVAPTPILVRPGDVMVMGGESRMAYHGIARVLTSDTPLPPLSKSRTLSPSSPLSTDGSAEGREGVQFNISEDLTEEEVERVEGYLKGHRINVNVRQVLPDGVLSFEDLNN